MKQKEKEAIAEKHEIMQALFAACFFLFYLPFKPED
jgi:hypothetical protein